jgi:cytoskeleton protein RodZ
MESQESMEQEGRVQPGSASGTEVGAALRAARERMGMSVDEVAGRLKFAPRQIIALENGELDQLPQLAFTRGFVRSYARLLQIDEKPLLDALPGAPAPAAIQVQAAAQEVPRGGAEGRKQNLFWLGGALAVAAVVVLAWKYDAGEAVPKATEGVKAAATGGSGEVPQGGEAAQPGAAAGAAGSIQSAGTAPAGGAMPAGETGAPSTAAGPATGTDMREAGQASETTQPSQTTPPPPTTQLPQAAQRTPRPGTTGSASENKQPLTVMSSAPKSPASAVSASAARARPKVAAAASGVAATHAQRGGHLVRLEFAEDSWVEVRDGNGKLLLSMLGKQGTSQNVAGPTPLSVVVGNAKGVKLFYKGEAIPLEPMRGSDVARLKLE